MNGSPNLQKKFFPSRLLMGIGLIVGAAAMMALQVFVFERINLWLSLGCLAAVPGGLFIMYTSWDYACAACAGPMEAGSLNVPPPTAGALAQALQTGNIPAAQQILSTSPVSATGGEVVWFQGCEKCQGSALLSVGPVKEMVLIGDTSKAIYPILQARQPKSED